MKRIEIKNYHFPLLVLLISRSTRSVAAGMLAISFPYLILNDLHHNALFLGSIFALATLFTAFLGLFFGTVTDIWGRKNTLILATLLLPIASFLLWWSNSIPVLFFAAILGGFSATGSLAGGGIGGTVQPIQNTVLADLAPKDRRTFYYSSFAFLNGITAAFGTITVKFLAVKEVFFLAGIISLLGTVVLLFLTTPDIKGKFRKMESKIVIGKFTMTGLLNGISQGLITPFFIPFFILFYKLPENRMSSFTFISGVIAAFSLLLAPYADKKFGFVKSITYTRALSVILILMFPVVKFLPLAIFIYCITPALRVLAVPIQQTAITSLVEENERGRALGINQVVRLVGSSVATELSGSLLSTPYIAVPFYLYGAIMGANIYLYKRFFAKEEKLKTP
ncbi:MAG: MFS transporter [Patescibacteria group bacterium]|nr:MFS transporter [Patescibacteria group bacterium]